MVEKTVRALVVEDDPSWQQILSEILTDLDLVVDLASSYPAAVETLRRESHRLAILDLSLGGTDHRNQDGLRVAEAVRRFDPECTILFLTGFATVELAVQVMKELGAFTCLRKEAFRRSEFRQVVGQAMAQASTQAAGTVSSSTGSVKKFSTNEVDETSGEELQGQALIVEDDAGWRELLSELLRDAGFTVRTSSSYVESIGLIKRSDLALAVVDLSLASSITQENMDGYRLLSSMQNAGVPVIVVSGYADPRRIEQAYKENLIFACMEKQSFDRKSFVKTVQSVGTAAAEDPVLQTLTDREREVLVLLARGLTNKEIAHDLIITPNTVKRHLKSLFAKLDVNTRSAASARAIKMGVHK